MKWNQEKRNADFTNAISLVIVAKYNVWIEEEMKKKKRLKNENLS